MELTGEMRQITARMKDVGETLMGTANKTKAGD